MRYNLLTNKNKFLIVATIALLLVTPPAVSKFKPKLAEINKLDSASAAYAGFTMVHTP